MRRRDRIYSQDVRYIDGKRLNVVVITCRCGASHDINVTTFKALPPEVIIRKAKEAGWDRSADRWTCPAHSAKAAPRPVAAPAPLKAPESPPPAASPLQQPKRRPPRPITPDEGAAIVHLINSGRTQAAISRYLGLSESAVSRAAIRAGINAAAKKTTLGASPMSTSIPTTIAATPIRQLTPKELRAVMSRLEETYDADNGRYLGGASDSKLAAELDVPRANVAKVRDEAFSALRTNPDLDKAFEICARLETELSSVRSSITTLTEFASRIENGLAEATRRITNAGA